MKIFLRIMNYSKPYWITIIIALMASIFFGMFNAASLWIVGSLIGTIMNIDTPIVGNIDLGTIHGRLDSFFKQILGGSDPMEQLKMVCICLFLTFLMKNIFYYINWVALATVELKIIRDIRNSLYEKIQKFPLSFFDRKRKGELLSITLNDVNSITVSFKTTFQVVLHEFVNMLILIVLIIMISPKLALIVLSTIPISAFIILKIGQSIRRKALRSSYKIADISSIITEKLSGIKIVKAFNMTKNEINLFFINNLKFYNLQLRQRKLIGFTAPVNDIIGVSLACILLWYGGQEVITTKNMSSENFMRFIIFLFALLQPARKLGNSVVSIQTGIVGASRAFSILDLNLREKEDTGLKSKKEFKNNIEFKDVTFNYNKNGQQVLKNINVKINKGEKIALVGASGAGKTTFANLLLDFYYPTKGEINMDGKNYKNLSTKSLRDIIGLVPQEPFLFNDTIRNNISYGQNIKNDDLIIRAAQNANIIEHINSLPDKFSSVVGENGVTLSGGQKQRLSIARAILKDPSILVLDEATSSLDSESEIKVQNAIDTLIKDRTVIIIAHRLSTILNADKIFVFDNGSIIESGKHKKLYDNNGLYKKLYDLQFKGENE